MSSRRSKQKGAIAGLRSIQTLGSLAVPGTIEEVPEEAEIKATKREIFASEDWKSVQTAVHDIFQERFDFETEGELYRLHEIVKSILESKTGTFLCDCYKEWLSREMSVYVESLRNSVPTLRKIEEIWTKFFTKALPLLEAVLYLVKPKGRQSIRTTTLIIFRDVVLLSKEVEGFILRNKQHMSAKIQQMALILQGVSDTYPPSKNKIQAELIAAQLCSPYLGYYGLYENGDLIIASNEPLLVAKRRPSADAGGFRRISRPFSIQPHHMDTLNQLFRTAVRHKSPRFYKPKTALLMSLSP